MKPYRPSGKVPSASYLKILLGAIVGGSAVGGFTHLISQLFYLIVLFPLGMGLAGVAVVSIIVTGGKVRNPLVASFAGLLTGFSIYGSMNYFDYLKFQNTAKSEILKEAETKPELKEVDPAVVIDGVLQSETNSTGFVGFVKYRAKQGVSIGRVGSSGGNIGETGTWIYWLLELGLIQAIIVYTAFTGAKEPFCESSNDWYKSAENVGNVDAGTASNFLELVNSGRFAEAGTLVHSDPQLITVDSLVVTKQVSPADSQADVFLKISKITVDKEGKADSKEILAGMVPTRDYQGFQPELITTPAAVSESDQFGLAHLAAADLQQLAQVLSNYPGVQAAYLASKVVTDNTQQIFHVLGVICDLSIANTEAKQINLVNDLTSEVQKIASFGEGKVLLLNNELKIRALIRKVTEQPIYHK
jgi:hypothetical protein